MLNSFKPYDTKVTKRLSRSATVEKRLAFNASINFRLKKGNGE
jgi:hypothetical protein